MAYRINFLILCALVGSSAQAAIDCKAVPKELGKMATADQGIRHRAGLMTLASSIVLNDELIKLNRTHAERLKELVTACGWPTEKTMGEPSATAAWLLVQHADHDLPFQQAMLTELGKHLAEGPRRKEQYAKLHDRVNLKVNGKQLYGTQLLVTDQGVQLLTHEIDSFAEVDARRAAFGMESLADYIARATASVNMGKK